MEGMFLQSVPVGSLVFAGLLLAMVVGAVIYGWAHEKARPAATERERALLRTVLEQMPEGIAYCAAPDARIVFVNDAAQRLVGGPIADRWGSRRYITYSLLVTAPLFAGFLLRRGDWIAVLCLAATGFVLVSSFSVTVALAQSYLPRRLGMAAGLIVGLAIGTGGIGVALLGWVADHWGLLVALNVIAIMPLVGFGMALFLPEPRP